MVVASTVATAAATSALPLRRTTGAASSASYCSNFAPLLPSNRGRRHPHLAVSLRKHHNSDAHPHSRSLARVISEEAEGNPSADDVVFDEETLRRDLERAIEEEDYALAAQLRDRLRLVQEDSKSAVLSANARFYHAFKSGDLAAMYSVWSKGDHVYVIHPGAGRISGYDLVMGSWEIVCNADYEFPLQIDLKNVEVHVRGNVGYVSCMEVVKSKGSGWGKQVATNVFEKVDGQWFMCIHHASHIDE